LIAQRDRSTEIDLARAGKNVEGDPAVLQKLKKLHELDSAFDFPIRKTFFNAKSKVFTNHYDVRAIIETAIESCAFLRNNKARFATDSPTPLFHGLICIFSLRHQTTSNFEETESVKTVNGNW
jgi:hypothetical protein